LQVESRKTSVNLLRLNLGLQLNGASRTSDPLSLEFGNANKLVKRQGVGQGVSIGDRFPFDDVSHRDFHLFPVQGDRNVLYLENKGRDVPGRGIFTDVFF